MMSIDKKKVMAAVIGCVLCLAAIGLIAIGFYIGKRVYNRPMDTDIQRDTVTLWDTIPHWYPVPVEVKPQKPQYKWLTKVEYSTDTLLMRDSVLVEVPIESKHYHANEYDAWVSGYEPNLDSIKVYQRTEFITETITRMKPPNRLSLDVEAGADYLTAQKDMATFAFGDLTYKIRDSRFAIGLRGGVIKPPADKSQMFVGGVVKLKIF